MNKPSAQLSSHFDLGLLFGVVNGKAMLLQVCDDFDIAQKMLRAQLGAPMPSEGLFTSIQDDTTTRTKQWRVRSQKDYDYVFSTFFRQFKPPHEVQNKPDISALLLMPTQLNRPIVPNDSGDNDG